MKKIIYILIIQIFFYLNLFADEKSHRQISVSGEATIYVVPDEVAVKIGIVSTNKDIKKAKIENEEITSKVLDISEGFKINKNEIQIDYITIYPKYEYGSYSSSGSSKSEFVGYEVRKNITVTLKEVTQYESYLTKLIQNGVNNIYNVEFKSSELRKFKDQARVLASTACKEKANLLAKSFSVKLGKPISIGEENQNYYLSNSNVSNIGVQNNATNYSNESNDSAVGKISIKAKIIASFEIE